MASTTTILELAEEHRQKYFPNEIYNRSCILQQNHYKNLADSIKRTFRRL
jgi:hypothetical protein